MTAPLGVFSEVGVLREAMVHRPDLGLMRLTPSNCRDFLFDDVLWVKKARQEHDVFVDTLRERNVIVHEFGAMLAESLANPAARTWLLDRRNSRKVPHRLEECGYEHVRNPAAKDGLWKLTHGRSAIYAKKGLSARDRIAAAETLVRETYPRR